jgi:hypothetical protein
MTVDAPPIYTPIVDEGGKSTLPWTLFFNSVFDGDAGTQWTPSFVNLTTVGTPTITGAFYAISNYLKYFRINITPDTSTSATAGSTYCDNLPFDVLSDGVCASASGLLGGSLGMVRGDTGRVYVPSWSGVTDTVSIVGIVEGR